MRDDLERLLDIKEAIEKIEKYYDRKKLEIDEVLQSAIVRYLEIIGEASRYLTKDIKDRSPETEWEKIVAFRNFVVHNYFDVDWDIVTKVIEKDMPKLKLQIDNIINYLKK